MPELNLRKSNTDYTPITGHTLQGQNFKTVVPKLLCLIIIFESLICIPKPRLQRFCFIWSGVEPKNLNFIKLPRKFFV